MLRRDDGTAFAWWYYVLLPFQLLVQVGCSLILVAIMTLTTVGLVMFGWQVLTGV